MVGISARPYFTRHLPMLELLKNLTEYCEGRWVGKLSVYTSSLATCQQRAQEARECRERRESSPSISERFPKLKVQASILLATQTPKPLTGRGVGKKNLDLFATNYFPAHRHSRGVSNPYELLWPARQAAPLAVALAVGNALTADARLDHVRARSPEKRDDQPLRGPRKEPNPPPLAEPVLTPTP